MSRPDDVRFTDSHEWARLEEGILTLGISDFAVEHLGDIVFVDLPEAGTEIAVGDTVLEIESVKAVAEVYSPVSGRVAEVNDGLTDDPASLSADCYGAGWLVRIEVSDPAGYEDLKDLAAYEIYLETAEPE